MKNKLITSLVVALSIIAFFILIVNKKNDLALVNDKVVLTSDDFYKEAMDKYLTNIVHDKVNEYIIETESKNIDYNDSEVKSINKKYNSIEDKDLIFTHYFYKKNYDKIDIQGFFKDKYGLNNAEVYEVLSYESNDHDELENIRKYLNENGLEDTIEKYGIKFESSYLFDLSIFDETYEHTSDNDLSKSFLKKSYHVMDNDGMKLVYVNKIINYKENPEIFNDLYFLNNYSTIKNDAINELKSKYAVEINQ